VVQGAKKYVLIQGKPELRRREIASGRCRLAGLQLFPKAVQMQPESGA
jgi:hypothetical protein